MDTYIESGRNFYFSTLNFCLLLKNLNGIFTTVGVKFQLEFLYFLIKNIE